MITAVARRFNAAFTGCATLPFKEEIASLVRLSSGGAVDFSPAPETMFGP